MILIKVVELKYYIYHEKQGKQTMNMKKSQYLVKKDGFENKKKKTRINMRLHFMYI